MKTKDEVFEDLISTIESSAISYDSSNKQIRSTYITNVELWAKRWREEYAEAQQFQQPAKGLSKEEIINVLEKYHNKQWDMEFSETIPLKVLKETDWDDFAEELTNPKK